MKNPYFFIFFTKSIQKKLSNFENWIEKAVQFCIFARQILKIGKKNISQTIVWKNIDKPKFI